MCVLLWNFVSEISSSCCCCCWWCRVCVTEFVQLMPVWWWCNGGGVAKSNINRSMWPAWRLICEGEKERKLNLCVINIITARRLIAMFILVMIARFCYVEINSRHSVFGFWLRNTNKSFSEYFWRSRFVFNLIASFRRHLICSVRSFVRVFFFTVSRHLFRHNRCYLSHLSQSCILLAFIVSLGCCFFALSVAVNWMHAAHNTAI